MSMFTVPSLPLPDGSTAPEQTIDLLPWAGQLARVHMRADGRLVVNPRRDTYWHIADIDVPNQQYDEVQDGTRTVVGSGEVFVTRGEGDVDVADIPAGASVVRVSFDYAPRFPSISSNELDWSSVDGAPEAGERYPVAYEVQREEPVYRQEPLPVVLNVLKTYDLPDEVK